MEKLTLYQQAEQCLAEKGIEEVKRHASVSTENRHYCHECFCCACSDLLGRVERETIRKSLYREHRSGE